MWFEDSERDGLCFLSVTKCGLKTQREMACVVCFVTKYGMKTQREVACVVCL